MRERMREDEPCVLICNPIMAEELELPDTVAVQTGLLDPNECYIIPKDEFLEWLREGGQEFMS